MHGWRRNARVLSSRPVAATLAVVTSVVPAVFMAVTPSAAGAATAYLTVTNPQLPPATIGQPYSAQFEVSGGTAPFIFDRFADYDGNATQLPPGLTLSSSGLVSGTPTQQLDQPVTTKFPVAVLDSSTPRQSTAPGGDLVSITVSPAGYVPPPPLQITTTSLPEASINKSYSATLQATGGTPPYSWEASGLPSGFTMSQDGTISGSSVVPSQTTVTVTVTDSGFYENEPILYSDEQQQTSMQFTFTVSSGVPQLDPTLFELNLNGLLNDVGDVPTVVENELHTLLNDLGLPGSITPDSLLSYVENALLTAIDDAVCTVDPTLKAFCGP